MVGKRKGMKFVFADPDDDPEVVSMFEWKGIIYVGMKKGVYRIEDDRLIRLEIVVEKKV